MMLDLRSEYEKIMKLFFFETEKKDAFQVLDSLR